MKCPTDNIAEFSIQDVYEPEKKLNKKFYLILTMLLASFPALSTDMYLPAIPDICDIYNAPPSLVNLSIGLFLTTLSFSTLFWGPLSDRYGRKKMLLIGVGMFSLSSLLCGLSADIYQLIVFRCIQAFGGGAATGISLAVLKDVFSGDGLEKSYAVLGTVIGFAPVLAPSAGALILKFASWRYIFVGFAVISAITFCMTVIMEETNKHPSNNSVFKTFSRIYVVLKNFTFFKLLINFSITSWPMFVFIGSAPIVFITQFGTSEQEFGVIFAANAIFLSLGSFLYIKVMSLAPRKFIADICFLMILAGGVLILLFGTLGPYYYLSTIIIATLGQAMVRPLGIGIMMEVNDGDTGTVSSLINSTIMFTGSLGMMIGGIEWDSRIIAVGCIYTGIGIFCILLWLTQRNKKYVSRG